jgi:hypothetical protein
MLPVEREAARERMSQGGGDKRVAKVSLPDVGKTSAKIGAFAGVSGRTVEKIAAAIKASARAGHARQAPRSVARAKG